MTENEREESGRVEVEELTAEERERLEKTGQVQDPNEVDTSLEDPNDFKIEWH